VLVPPKSQAFRRIERHILGPVMRDLGFTRPPGVGLSGWLRQEPGGWLVIWTQLSNWNYGDEPEGYRFTLELQLGAQPKAGSGLRRRRYYDLLDDARKQEHLTIHNRAIAKARPNPMTMSFMNPREQAGHLDELRQLSELPDRWDDPWFVYVDEDDVQAWMEFLATALPTVIDRFLSKDDPAFEAADIPER
jgi:hypothetical protein